MNKLELFEKYKIDESHNAWDMSIDNWYSVEIFRKMNNGDLPNKENETTLLYITDFLDKCHDDIVWFFSLENRGIFYITAKRQVYKFSEQILIELNSKP